MPMSRRVKALSGCQKARRPRSSAPSISSRSCSSGAGSRAPKTSTAASALIAASSTGRRRIVDLEGGTHELGLRALEHDQEGDAEQAEGHAPADIEVIGREERRLGDPEQRQDDQKENVVAAVVVLVAIADQGGEQQGDDGEQEEIVAQQEQRDRPAAAEAHADALENPSRRKKHQGSAVIAADADPVLGRRQQKAAEDGPAEAEEHFVGMPLDRREILRRGGQDALENQDPDDRQAQPGEAGEGEERPEADQPQGVSAREHGAQVSLRRTHCRTGGEVWP